MRTRVKKLIDRSAGIVFGVPPRQRRKPNQMDTQDQRRFGRQFARPIGGAVPRPDLALAAGRGVTTENLFQGSREIGIEHYGSLYRLKITRQGKLILNK